MKIDFNVEIARLIILREMAVFGGIHWWVTNEVWALKLLKI